MTPYEPKLRAAPLSLLQDETRFLAQLRGSLVVLRFLLELPYGIRVGLRF